MSARATDLAKASCVFACLDSVFEHVNRNGELPRFDVVLVDECHHAGAMMYQTVLRELRAGQASGPFLIGLTATPWRPDDADLQEYFGEPLVSVDLVTGLRKGFLTNVDYRMYTDNINWEASRRIARTTVLPASDQPHSLHQPVGRRGRIRIAIRLERANEATRNRVLRDY